jgi:glutamyl-Q tRNA(Asp) synthetase
VRVTRFAPSPTGPLHLGHVYAALVAEGRARAVGGRFLLRIEDIDRARSRIEYEQLIYDDLSWIGSRWDGPVLRQSDRLPVYATALKTLGERGLLYPCRCTRGDIRAALSAPQEGAPIVGPDGLVYPGTCRGRRYADLQDDDALRLDMQAAIAALGGPSAVVALGFTETGPIHPGRHALDPDHLVQGIGDVVLARRDMGTSYHLAVVVDDAEQGVTEVTRGVDLFEATPLHRLLQALLGLPVPDWHHHDLIRDAVGKRLAKRDDARAIAAYRAAGETPAQVRARVGVQ